MQKKNIFQKKINKLVLSITNTIESFFNFFREKFFYKKNISKSIKTIDKRIFLVLAIICITFISYFSIPAFYDKNKLRAEIENQIFSQYNLEVKLGSSLKYGLLPKPHFYSENTIISYNSYEIAKSNNLKVSIFSNNLFSFSNLKIKNLRFRKTDFKIDSTNIKFFTDQLKNIKNKKRLSFLNSKLFFIDQNDNVIFFSDIKNLNFSFEENSLKKLESKIKIFNIPINIISELDKENKKIITKINSHPLRLGLEGYSNFDNEKFDGQLDLTIINKNKKISYIFKDNFLQFNTNDEKIKGKINIKPFFLSTELNLSPIDFKNISKNDSILINILKSEILNNNNLNGKLTFNIKDMVGVNFFEKTKFIILLEEGNIFIEDFKTTFNNFIRIDLDDTQLIVDNNKLNLAGYVALDFLDVKKFFEHFQISIKDRKYIKKVNFGFLFHLDEKFIEIENLKIDGNTNQKLNDLIKDFNSKKEIIFNKIVLRNSVKDFFKIISMD